MELMSIRRGLLALGRSQMIGQFSKHAQMTQSLNGNANLVIANPLGVKPKLVIIETQTDKPSNKTRYCVATDVCSAYRYTTGSSGAGAYGLPVETPEDVVPARHYFGEDQIVVGCAASVRAWTGTEYTIDIYA